MATGPDQSRTPPPEPAVGLCARCRHVRRVGNRKGSVFYRCGRAADDPRYPPYPPLPVRVCRGYEADGDGHENAAPR